MCCNYTIRDLPLFLVPFDLTNYGKASASFKIPNIAHLYWARTITLVFPSTHLSIRQESLSL